MTSTTFSIRPSSNSSVGTALNSEFTLFSQVNESAVDCQDLVYKLDLSEYTTMVLNPGQSGVLHIDKIPINGTVMTTSAFSTGLSDLTDDVLISAFLGRDISSTNLSPGSQLLISPLEYSKFISGTFKPSAPYHPITEVFRSDPITPRFLNIELVNNGTTPVTLDQGSLLIQINFMQADTNNSSADGYPTGGIPTGPRPGFPELPVPGSAPIPPPEPIEPVQDLRVEFNAVAPGSPGYGTQYKPTFLWTVPPNDENYKDIYMNWTLYQDNGQGSWIQISRFTHRPLTSSTPLGLLLNPFPFLTANDIYRIQIEIVVHRADYPEQSTSSYLVFSGDPYPPVPPPVINPPSVPLNLTGVGGQYEVNLKWNIPASSGGALVTSYVVQQAPEESPGVPGTFSTVATPTDTNANITNLLDSTKYYFKVAATNSAGTGDFTAPIEVETGPEPASVPGKPQDLAAIGKTQEVDVSWKPPVNDGGKAITGYQLQRSLSATGPWTNEGPIADSLSKVVTGLADNTTYYFRVAADNSVGLGPYTDPVSATTSPPTPPQPPGAPVLRTVTAGPAEATLLWEAPADSGTTTITDYKVEQAPDSGGSPGVFATVDTLNALTTTITGLTPNSTYWYRVSATNSAGYGPTSDEKSVTPTQPPSVPSVPLDLQGSGGVKQVIVTWKPPAQLGGSPISNYTVDISTSSTGPFTSISAGTALKEVINDIGGVPLSDDTSYFVKVSATNTTGTGPFTAIITVKTNPPPPVAPSEPLSLAAQGLVEAMLLTWQPPTNNGGATVTSYDLQRADDNGAGAPVLPYVTIATISAPTLSYLDDAPPLPPGVNSYFYRVAATNSVGTGAFSTEVIGTTVASATAPDAPTLNALQPGVNKLLATWVAGANGGSPITEYNVQISSTSATTGFAPATGSPVAAPDLTLVINGLGSNTSYWVRVNAVNSVGDSPWSNVEKGTTSNSCGDCDGCNKGTVTQWNGSSSPSLPVPNPSATPLSDDAAFGAEILWNSTGMTFGVPKSAGGPGCVKDWTLEVFQGTTLIATYSQSDPVLAPRNFYILNSTEGPHGKDPTVFLVPNLQPETSYELKCTPEKSSVTPIRNVPPTLSIPFKTGKPVTPPSTDCDSAEQGTAIQWNGTIASSSQENGTDKTKPNDVGCKINWTHQGLKYSKCVTGWTVAILQTATSTTPLDTKVYSAQQTLNVVNYSSGVASDWVITALSPSTTYYVKVSPNRNALPGWATPPDLGPVPFRMGNPYSPPGPPVPPVPISGNLPQTYVTTYGLPSWGTTDMVSYLSQSFYSSGTPLGAKDAITVQYNQHQSWSMVRNWAKAFFHSYASFIVDNEEITNAMILIGDWAPILPGSGLPVQASTISPTATGDQYGQVAGSAVNWNIEKANYSYCAPNGPVDFGLSYNPDNTNATPPTSVGTWWEDDPDMIGCPLILDFLIPLARSLKGKGPNGTDRIVEISVNGDVSKNGNDGAYGSLDCGNYTAADQRLNAASPSQVILECLIDPVQQWVVGNPKNPGLWGPLGKTKTQSVTISGVGSQSEFNTLVSGLGKPGNPISQNNLGPNAFGTTATIASSPAPSYDSSNKLATFHIDVVMAKDGNGRRTDGAFTVTSTDPSVIKYKGDAKLYFGKQTDISVSNPTGVGTLYPVVSTDPAIGIFLKNWVVQQSKEGGDFPTTADLLDPSNVADGGIIGQIASSGAESWESYAGSVKVFVNLASGVTEDAVKPLLKTGPYVAPPQYNTSNPSDPSSTPKYKHRVYFVPATWDPNKDPLPAPTSTTEIYDIRVGNLGVGEQPIVPTIFNYGTVDLSATPTATGGATNRALGNGSGNSTPGDGGWLPADWFAKEGDTHYPAYWNTYPTQNLPVQPGGTKASIDSFSSPGALVMGGGNVFIGNGTGACSGRGSYFDPTTVTTPTERPGLVTLSGTGTGKKGTFFSYDTSSPTPATSARVGFPLDNLHQSYLLIYRINQKIMEYNYKHSTKNGYPKTGPDADLVVPLISHVHHDKESYQVNKTPKYPVCDPVTGEIEQSWLLLGNTVAEIEAMSPKEYEVWKRSRQQTSVAYEKYLYNRYMPAEYLPDWRTGGASGSSHNLAHNTGCFVPNTGDKSSDGFSQTGAEPMWDPSKPWNVNQQRNFGTEPVGTATAAGTNSGIGNYSNDLRSRLNGDAQDGIQRYQMGWVNYAVTAWTYGIPPGQTIDFTCDPLPSALSVGDWVSQETSNASGKVSVAASAGATTLSVTLYQGTFTGNYKLDVYSGGATPVSVNVSAATPGTQSFTSQGTNEAYQELYNIGEVKPPVNLVWDFNNATKDKDNNPLVPIPNVTINQSGLTNYVGGTATGVMVDSGGGSTPVTAVIDSIYNTSSLVLKDGSIAFPNMFSVGTSITLSITGQPNLTATVTAVDSPTENGPFPSEFVELINPSTSNEYGKPPYNLPDNNSGQMIPNGMGSACIPGGATPTCPGPGKAVFCPVGTGSTSVGPYYRLNAVTNTLIARIFDKYGASGDWPFLGDNSVNVGSNISSPALTDLWLRFDAIDTGVIPLDGRGFAAAPGGTGTKNGPKDTDGTFAPLQSPYVSPQGLINLETLYNGTNSVKSNLDGTSIVTGSSTSFVEPKGPRQAIALFANEYIGGALTLDPTARPGTAASQWLPVTKGEPSAGTLGPNYLPGSVPSWVGSRGMEVVVYATLTTNKMNLAFVKTDGTVSPPFSKPKWNSIIQTNKPEAQAVFKNAGHSFAANSWGGEYNGLSAIQSSDSKIGYRYMQEFLKSCGSMMGGKEGHQIGSTRVGLYTIGFIPETWLTGPTL